MQNNDVVAPLRFMALGLTFCMPAALMAAPKWEVTPEITATELYSDNIELEPEAEAEEDFITHVAPKVSLTRQSKRMNFESYYQVDHVVYSDHDDENQSHHEASVETNTELMRDFFFFDVLGKYNQSFLTRRDGGVADKVSGLDNRRTDVGVVQLNPYFDFDLKRTVEVRLGYDYELVEFRNGEADSFSDSKREHITASLNSGVKFVRMYWWADFNKDILTRDQRSNTKRENVDAGLEYNIFDNLRVSGRAGYENNELEAEQSAVDGSYWSAGFIWSPHRTVELSAFAGKNFEEAEIRWTPNKRVEGLINFRKMDVGVNPAERWRVELRRDWKRNSLTLQYDEEVTSVQSVIIRQFSEEELEDLGFDGAFTGFDLFTVDVADSDFEEKTARIRYDFRGQYNYGNVVIFDERRAYLVEEIDDHTFGARASWTHMLSARNELKFQYQWQDGEIGRNQISEEVWFFSAEWIYKFGSRTKLTLGGRRAELYSNDDDREYKERRVWLSVNKRF